MKGNKRKKEIKLIPSDFPFPTISAERKMFQKRIIELKVQKKREKDLELLFEGIFIC